MRKVPLGYLTIAIILLPSIFYVLSTDRSNVAFASYLFQDGFESGNTTAWTKITNDTTATCKVTNSTSKEGAYSLNIATTVANSFSYIGKTLSSAKVSLYFNWSMYFSSIPRLDSDRLMFARIKNSADQTLLSLDLNWHDKTGLKQRLLMYQPNVSNEVASNVTVGQWYWFQVNYTVDSVGGGADFWINGVKTNSLSHLNNTGLGQPLTAQVGICYGSGNAFGAYVDCCIIDSSYISSTPPPPPNQPNDYLLLKAQFHIHTNFSDGDYTPEEVVDMYKSAGYDVIAITDHSTTDGCARAKAEGDKIGLMVITGEEITNTFPDGTDQHILGLFLQATIPSEHNVSDPKPFFDQIHAQNGLGCVAHSWVLYAGNWTTEYNFTQRRWYPFVGQPWIDGWSFVPYDREPQSTYDTILGDGYYIEFDHDFHSPNDVHRLAEYWTVVEAYNKTEAGIKDALLHQRTVCYDTGALWGTPNAISIYLNSSTTPPSQVNPSAGLSQARYIVWCYNSTHYAARNMTSSLVECISTNASAVINNAIGNMTFRETSGGIIHIMSGRYNLTAPINLRGWLTLEGDGAESTVLRVVPGSNCNALQFTGPKIENEFFTMIRDLQLHGAPSDTIGNGIQLDSTGHGLADWILENVFIQRFPVDDMYFNSYNGWAARILACTFEYAGRYAIEKSDGEDERIIGNKFLYNANGIYLGRSHDSLAIIDDNFFYKNSGYGIVINGSSSNVISGNTFFENSWGNDNAYDDIYVQSGSGNEITGNIFAGMTNVRYGVNLDSAALSNGVTGNNFNAPFRSGPIHNSGQSNLVTNNVGFITENSGSTASCVNGTWIAHGLAGAPNGECRLEVNGSRLINSTCFALDPTIIAENSTHVQIEFLCSNNGTLAPVGETEAKPVIWCFEYKP